MRLYWEVARATARRMATYRGATVAGIVTNTVFGFILGYVLLAVFRERPQIGGFDATDAVTFVFVSQGMIMVVGIFGHYEMADRVKSGEVVVDLCRPYDQQAWWAAVHCGKAWFYVWARGVPPFALGALALDLQLPPEVWIWPAFAVAVALAVGVAFAWGFLLQTVAFWIVDVRGPVQLGWIVAMFLSGTMAPVQLFPDGLEPLVRALPFSSLVQLPAEVFLGKHEGPGLVGVYLLQALWLAVLAVAGRAVMARAVRRVVVHGG